MSSKNRNSPGVSKIARAEHFAVELRCARLRRLQQLLAVDEADSSQPQALLGIIGIDSRFNEGMHEFFNYLMFGGYEARKVEMERLGYEEENLSDVMLCVRRDSIDVYCNPISYGCILPYVACWRNLHVHCLDTVEYENEDAAEEFKVKTLVTILKGCSMIGLPFSAKGHGSKFDMMKIEQWPIIQAYALEGYGSGVFFTLQYSVIDLSEKLEAIYREVDPPTLTSLVTELLPCFDKQWNNMERTIDVAISGSGISELSVEQVAEPLFTYHSHGQVGLGETSGRRPYVLFGCDTSKVQPPINACDISGLIPTNATAVGKLSDDCLTHMICQGVAPRNDVCCSRTYFFGNEFDTNTSEMESLPQETSVVRILCDLYKAAIEAVLKSIEVYSKSPQIVSEATAAALAVIDKKRGPDCKFLAQVMIQAADELGRTVTLKDGDRSRYPKTAAVVISDIRISKCRDACIGAIVFSECFVESTISVKEEDGSQVVNSDYIVLTQNIPRWLSWVTSQEKRRQWSAMPAKIACDPGDLDMFGRLLLQGHTADIAANNMWTQPISGFLFLYEKGVVFIHSRLGPIIIPRAAIKSIDLFDGDSPSVPAFIFVTIEKMFCRIIPTSLESEDQQIAFILGPKTKAYKNFFAEVLHVWRSPDVAMPFRIIEDIPDVFRKMQDCVQARMYLSDSWQAREAQPSSAGQTRLKSSVMLPGLSRFQIHLTASFCLGSRCLTTADIPAVLNQSNDAGSFFVNGSPDSAVQLLVTIISGIPGSYKENLCNTLTALTQENSRWVVFKQPLDAAVQRLNTDSLQATLQQYYGNLKKKAASGSSSKSSRILVMTPGYTEVADIVKAVLNHPNPDVAAHVKIGAVTTCIDPLNTFMFGRHTLPKLLDMCSLGWVNNIVFTSCTDLKSKPLAAIQEFLRAANDNVAFILADRGEVTRSADIDLILSNNAFDDKSLRRSRILCGSQGTDSCTSSNMEKNLLMSQCVLKFGQPLVKSKLVSKLRALKSTLKGQLPGSIYHVIGRVRFEDSPNMFEVSHTTLSGCTHTELVSSTASPSHTAAGSSSSSLQLRSFLVFVGYGLQERTLQDWLRECTTARPEQLAVKSLTSLSSVELKKIHDSHHLEPLPPGWFYNGSHYVSLMGDKSDTHPNMALFVQSYLEEENRHAEEFNLNLASIAYRDLFE